MTLYKIPPMPWVQLDENHWRAITPLGTWDVHYVHIRCLDVYRWEWALTVDGDCFVNSGLCEDAEEGKRLAEAERERILTESLEQVNSDTTEALENLLRFDQHIRGTDIDD